MKTLLLTLSLLLICLVSKSQNSELPKDDNGKITFTEVVQVDSANAAELFSRAQMAMTALFKSPKDVIQLKDEASKQIVAKGVFNNSGFIEFETTIQCKDGRYKYIITNFVHTSDPRYKYSMAGGNLENEKPSCGTFYMPMRGWNKIKENTKTEITSIVERLKKNMASTKASNSDKW